MEGVCQQLAQEHKQFQDIQYKMMVSVTFLAGFELILLVQDTASFGTALMDFLTDDFIYISLDGHAMWEEIYALLAVLFIH